RSRPEGSRPPRRRGRCRAILRRESRRRLGRTAPAAGRGRPAPPRRRGVLRRRRTRARRRGGPASAGGVHGDVDCATWGSFHVDGTPGGVPPPTLGRSRPPPGHARRVRGEFTACTLAGLIAAGRTAVG